MCNKSSSARYALWFGDIQGVSAEARQSCIDGLQVLCTEGYARFGYTLKQHMPQIVMYMFCGGKMYVVRCQAPVPHLLLTCAAI